MKRRPETRVIRRTVELAGIYSQGLLRGDCQRAFASGKSVRFDGRRWRVARFEVSGGARGTTVSWSALLVNEEPEL